MPTAPAQRRSEAHAQPLVAVITNPNSRKNLAQPRRVARLERIVGDAGFVCQTPNVDAIAPVVADLSSRGVRYWVCDGGDGTFHWMLNAVRNVVGDAGLVGDDAPVLVPTNSGTIDFVARKAGIHGRPDDIVKALVADVRAGRPIERIQLPTLEVIGSSDSGSATGEFRRLGFAVALGGIGQRVFTRYYLERDRGARAIARVIAKAVGGILGELPGVRDVAPVPDALREHARFLLAGTRAHVKVDGRVYPFPLFQGLHAGSIDMNIGGIRLFPFCAEPGNLHMVVAGPIPLLDAAYQWIWLLFGKVPPSELWNEFPGRHLEVRPHTGELLDPVIDGELFHGLDRADVRPGTGVYVPRVRPAG